MEANQDPETSLVAAVPAAVVVVVPAVVGWHRHHQEGRERVE